MLTKQETIGRRHPGGEQQGKGTQENCSAMWLTVSGFMVMGLVPGFSLVNHSDSGSFLGGTHVAQSRWMPERRILGGGRTRLTFPELFPLVVAY